ncbi:MAG: response regulator, partial [Pseudomonadales bacterium]|nr:response regulator [Pseudomonadales bacterium]
AECMGGQIGFTSVENEGSEFWFTAQLQLSTQQAQKLTGLQEITNKRALIISDSAGVTESLAFHLTSLNIEFASLEKHETPLEKLIEAEKSKQPFELVFLNLPVSQPIDFELVKTIQASEQVQQPLHILVLSSLPQRADAMRLGLVNEYDIEWLSKPVTREKLCKALLNSYEIVAVSSELEDKTEANQEELEGKRILLVEDNAVNQMVARGMLHKLGYVVTSVINGKEALGILEEKPFDLILMDCMMPILDGYETTKAWRELEADSGAHIPIIAMTASVVEGEHQKCLSVGMDDYLSKPVNLEELDAKIRQWIGGKGQENADTVIADKSQSANQKKSA